MSYFARARATQASTSSVVWLVGKKISTMIDNAYRHLNKADNLRSLRRAPA